MDIIDSLILGLVQGLYEYLPISSSGHLEICQDLLGLNMAGADSMQYDVALHVATVLSTIVILWHEFSGMCRSFFTLRRDENTSLVCKILVSCIPVGIVGICFKEQVEGLFGANLSVVGISLCVTALLLSFAYFTRTLPSIRRRGVRDSMSTGRPIGYFDAFIIGCAQAVAVIPGLSRSGTTIATGILLGNRRDKVAKFSFLMVIIPILGQGLLDVYKGISGDGVVGGVSLGALAVGFIAAFVSGCIACKWMIELVKRGRLVWFALYCLIVGTLCLTLG